MIGGNKTKRLKVARTESGRLVCMSRTAMRVLSAVRDHPESTYTELERHTGVASACLMVYAQRLEEAKLITRKPHRDNPRQRMLVLREGVDLDLEVIRI